jgi:hypothetical protein
MADSIKNQFNNSTFYNPTFDGLANEQFEILLTEIRKFQKELSVKEGKAVVDVNRKQYIVSKTIDGAILELIDIDTKQFMPIVNHPKLQRIRQFLGSGVGVLGWNDDSYSDHGTRWINTVFCLDHPYKVIDVHGPWADKRLSPFIDGESDLVAILNEDWYAHPKAFGETFWEIKW